MAFLELECIEQHHLFEVHSGRKTTKWNRSALVTDRYNEYVMTGLRTIWGVSLDRIEAEFGQTYSDYLHKQAQNS
jgi:coproporphyrinogen III oxidase-like Fe-S oxidoreductase